MGIPAIPEQCSKCRHFEGLSDLEGERDDGLEGDVALVCTAFPEGIPEEIELGEFDHRKPHPKDHGIRFKAI